MDFKMKKLSALLILISFNLFANEKTICGDTDDRTLSNETEIGRASKLDKEAGCTVTLISENCIVTAGHCLPALEKISFNVPESVEGSPSPAILEDVYLIDKKSIKFKANGEGDDWAVAKVLRNKITNRFPGNVQGHLDVRLNRSVKKGLRVRVTGYGADSKDPNRHFAQQTHTGTIRKLGGFFGAGSRLGYDVDTMGGNSGSAVVLEDSKEIIGVHSHGTCNVWGPYNEGTLISKNREFKKAIQACLRKK